MIFMKVHENENGFISPFIYESLRIFAKKKWTLEMLAVPFWGFSTKSLL